MYPEDLKYTKTHEWIKVEGNVGTIGITDFAAKELTDLVYIELPSVGEKIAQGSSFGTIESVKAVSDLNSPVTGEVIQTHLELSQQIDLISKDSYGEGWMIKVKVKNPDELNNLMDSKKYEDFVKEEEK
ncbi:MAG: glycine cleavage system protein GcvH [Candidatus Aerophobetes bacterium]|nr:glycine cleavage system protein GcvH [Candidatus Aerophobetes bacterium]